MNKWIKSCILVAIVSCILGFIIIAIGSMTGALSAFVKAVQLGEFSYRFGDISQEDGMITTYMYFVEDESESYTYELSEIKEISLDLVGAEVYIYNTKEEKVKVNVYASKYVNLELEDGELNIETDYDDSIMERSMFDFTRDTSPVQVDIYLPVDSGFVLEDSIVSNVQIGSNNQIALDKNNNLLYHEGKGSTFYIECTAGNVEINERNMD